MSVREIASKLSISRPTVRGIIKNKGETVIEIRKDKIALESEELLALYKRCEGYKQRMHEILAEERGIKIGYSTLTNLCRELEPNGPVNRRCERVEDVPGEEFQHDTSPYKLEIGTKRKLLVGSMLYYRYSKVRYLKFYGNFTRFHMKCFFHEALSFWGYVAKICVIDNTNLARLRGTGKNAVMIPEMAEFGKRYGGFEFQCHAVKHCNRKAGNERSFWTVETNFFPGRKFSSLEDLNEQAFKWSTETLANRPIGRTMLIPINTFEIEKSYLNKLPPLLSAPYRNHERVVDQYGYVAFSANYYHVPGTKRGKVIVLEYSDHIRLYQDRKFLISYRFPVFGTKGKLYFPFGERPINQPKYRKNGSSEEEKKLREMDALVNSYFDFALKEAGYKKHKFIRTLYHLSKKIDQKIFIKSIERALKYQITDTDTIERIAVLQIKVEGKELPYFEVDLNYKKRDAYYEGEFTESEDLKIYDKLGEETNG